MLNMTRVLSNVGLVAIVAMLFTGCALLPAQKDVMEEKLTADDPEFTQVSDDDSLDAIEAELDATVIEDEDFSDLEVELDSEDYMMEK